MNRRVKDLGKSVISVAGKPVVWTWRPYTRLFLATDSPLWTISEDMKDLKWVAGQLGIQTPHYYWTPAARNQCVFFGSHFLLLARPWIDRPHRIATAYFHGKPGTGVPGFDVCFDNLSKNHTKISRIQVTCSDMLDLVLSSGISREKVFLIPIGINLAYFGAPTSDERTAIRRQLGIPDTSAVIGSFQKDGQGWGEGHDPKLIKGPDIFLGVMALLKERIREIFVLLSGPARGYVKRGLEKLSIPYRHVYLKRYRDVAKLYHALDAYLIPSRQEGGPKAVLESLASGVPLVTTRVGQAADLIRHGQNGWIADVEDVEGLASWVEHILSRKVDLAPVISAGINTAADHSHAAHIPLWGGFMKGFVENYH